MVIWRGISPYNLYFIYGDNMIEFKSAWDITQDLHNLLYDIENLIMRYTIKYLKLVKFSRRYSLQHPKISLSRLWL